MNKLKRAGLAVVFFISITGTSVLAQKTTVYIHEDAEFKTGIELFQKEKYGAAQKSFRKYIASSANTQSLLRIDAEYYNAICAIELFNKDGELYLKQFIKDHPESPKVKTAYFYLGKYNYRKKKWRDALEWFQKVDIYDLTTEELAEFYFKRGYSSFSVDKFEDAKKDLFEIKDVDNKYAGAAKYYYAHIAYTEKNYETALTDFLKLEKNETFGPVVPYYIAQLYYLQGKYEKVIEYAPALLDSANTKRAPEIARVLGESYYRTNRYKEAIPHLMKYEKSSGPMTRKDNFQLGYAYYKINECDDAVNYFIKVTNIDDSLVQSAYYHMGDCYIKLDNKQNARNAFGQASKLEFDKVIQEDALYNYAKLCYELAYNPYSEAIKAFQKYIKNYPDSPRIDEAYTFLVNVFMTSKNYKEALEAIESIKVMTPELKQVHQKIAYYRGVELYNNADYREAVKLFTKSTTYTFDKNISAQALYWKGESFYRLQDYEKAINSYQGFISEPGSIARSEYSDVNYNIGYSFYKMKDWDNSTIWFRKYVTFKPQADGKKVNDALNRIGDGYFMKREFANAVDYYGQSYKMKQMNPDYALFQKALASGVLKKYNDKINDLKSFITNYSGTGSTYTERARFELAQTYYVDNQTDNALLGYKKFIDDYSKSQYVNTALSKIGLIYYAKKDDENALAYFDKLIKRDRKSQEAIEAILTVKAIYVAQGKVQEMADYLASVGAAIPQAEQDSTQFNIGKRHWMEQDCKSVVADFDKYIQKYPEGIFITEAAFYKAECDYKLGNTDAALTAYMIVTAKNKNQFTEQSLYRASDILFRKKDYAKATEQYKQLELQAEDPKNNTTAKIGLMRCYYQQKDLVNASDYARKIVLLDKISREVYDEAHYTIAQALFAEQKYDDAFAEYKALANSSKNEYGAESSYMVANLLFMKNEYKQSEKAIFDFINGDGDYPYWITKALILLADNYVALKDNFQAKTTLKSIITDSDIPELIKIAQEKLDKIVLAEEAAKQAKSMTEQINVEFEGNQKEQDRLFTEPGTTEPKPEGGPKNE